MCRLACILPVWADTVEEDEEDSGVGQLLSTQKVDVLHSQVEGQLDDGAILHVSSDVGHQSQIFYQTTSLDNNHTAVRI